MTRTDSRTDLRLLPSLGALGLGAFAAFVGARLVDVGEVHAQRKGRSITEVMTEAEKAAWQADPTAAASGPAPVSASAGSNDGADDAATPGAEAPGTSAAPRSTR